MEENTLEPTSGGCINCGSVAVLKGYPNALCQDCREKFIKYPIPLWIKLFAGGIGLIFLFSLYKIPANISLGVHLEKGKTALEDKRYLTAQRELQQAVKKLPNDIQAEGYLLIAAFYNQDFEVMSKAYEKLKDKRSEDTELFDRINNTLAQAEDYFPDDAFNAVLHKYGDDFEKVPDKVLVQYIDSNAVNTFAAMAYASRLYGKDEYIQCDTVLQKIIAKEPDYFSALSMMAGVKRQLGQFDASIDYCNRMIALNKESVYAISSKSRTMLKSKRDDEALKLALQAASLDEKDAYNMGSLLMIYHFTNKTKEKEEVFKKISALKDSVSIQTVQYAKDVVSGKEFFRK
jgi:tetratricopeptide (TPR) repeat protein